LRPLVIAADGAAHDRGVDDAVVLQLAQEVQRLCPGRIVVAAALADHDSLPKAVSGLERPIAFLYFMSDGANFSSDLPRRLGAAGVEAWVTTVPFGLLYDL